MAEGLTLHIGNQIYQRIWGGRYGTFLTCILRGKNNVGRERKKIIKKDKRCCAVQVGE